MDETKVINKVELRGTVCEKPHLSHESRGEMYYQFPLEIERLSGTVDKINIIARGALMEGLEVEASSKLSVRGELRSFNNKSNVGSRLVITVFAKELTFEEGEDVNTVCLTGTLCKDPTLRTTPMGREICDMMLAVNRRYGRSDYLPCIAWGIKAKDASTLRVGDGISLDGRIQSRKYIKNLNNVPIEKTAYEVSIIQLRENPKEKES